MLRSLSIPVAALALAGCAAAPLIPAPPGYVPNPTIQRRAAGLTLEEIEAVRLSGTWTSIRADLKPQRITDRKTIAALLKAFRSSYRNPRIGPESERDSIYDTVAFIRKNGRGEVSFYPDVQAAESSYGREVYYELWKLSTNRKDLFPPRALSGAGDASGTGTPASGTTAPTNDRGSPSPRFRGRTRGDDGARNAPKVSGEHREPFRTSLGD